MITMKRQPTDESCGPTALDAVYRHYGEDFGLSTLVAEVGTTIGGGTTAAMLGIDAISRGFSAAIRDFSPGLFDPSWDGLPVDRLYGKLSESAATSVGKKRQVLESYMTFIEAGGLIDLGPWEPGILLEELRHGPAICGLCCNSLYRSPRERFVDGKCIVDDLRGGPCGHFVVTELADNGRIAVHDPWDADVTVMDESRLAMAILLGSTTLDSYVLAVRRP